MVLIRGWKSLLEWNLCSTVSENTGSRYRNKLKEGDKKGQVRPCSHVK